ncbi:MAG: TIGR01777 family protein, partial [Gemmatimonadetes bacterium]
MGTHTFRLATLVDTPADEVFAWHMRPGALERLTPAWAHAEVLERRGGPADGGTVTLQVRRGPTRFRWTLRHTDYEEGRLFRDEQVDGPLGSWVHTHRFTPQGEGCLVEDEVEWSSGSGATGLIPDGLVTRDLASLFAFRHHRLRNDLALLRRYGAGRPLRVGITGSSGFLGTQLRHLLTTQGHSVLPIRRRRPAEGETAAFWNPHTGEIDTHLLEGLDAVVHLAGESIADGRWT